MLQLEQLYMPTCQLSGSLKQQRYHCSLLPVFVCCWQVPQQQVTAVVL